MPEDGSDHAAAQKTVEGMSKTLQSLAREKGLLLDFGCMTFASGSQELLGSYGAWNIRLMRRRRPKTTRRASFKSCRKTGSFYAKIYDEA